MAEERTPSGGVFGSEFEESATAPGGALDFLDDETVEETEASPEEEVADETEDQPSEEEAPESEETEEEEEEPSAEEAPLIFGRFKSIEDAEASYKHMQALQKRTAEEAASIRSKAQRAEELEKFFTQVRPVLEQLKNQRRQPQVPPDFDPSDPQQIDQYVNQLVEQRMKAVEGQFEQKLTKSQIEQQRQAEYLAAQDFWRAHPDAAPETEVDIEIGNIVRELRRDEQGQEHPDAFPLTRENLEIAYSLAVQPQLREMVESLRLDPTDDIIMQRATEAIENPQMTKVLKANPDWITTEEGMDMARQHAALPTIVKDVKRQATAPDPRQDPSRAFVATGGNGSPQGVPSGESKDEFDEVLDNWTKTRNSVFGV